MNKHLVTKASEALQENRELIYRLSLLLFIFTILFLLPSSAYAFLPDDPTIPSAPPPAAGAGDPLTATLCEVVSWFTGPLGRGIATLGIVVLGIGALLGKVSWQLALIVAVGVSIMFSGGEVVKLITGKDLASTVCTASQGDSGMLQDVICKVADLLKSTTGRALVTVGVMVLGIGALMGKVSHGAAITTAIGIALIMGAPTLVTQLNQSAGGNVVQACSPTTRP